MTTITQHSSGTDTRQIPIGAKLQSARELMRLDRKDAAAQLRLTENVIDMIETDSFPDDMPQIFIRGYIRSYGKLLQLSDEDIQASMEPVKPKAPVQSTQPAPAAPRESINSNISSQTYIMQGLTAGIACLMIWLVAAWWHGRTSAPLPENASAAELVASADSAAPAGVSVQLGRPVESTAATMAAVKEVGAVKTIAESDTEDR